MREVVESTKKNVKNSVWQQSKRDCSKYSSIVQGILKLLNAKYCVRQTSNMKFLEGAKVSTSQRNSEPKVSLYIIDTNERSLNSSLLTYISIQT